VRDVGKRNLPWDSQENPFGPGISRWTFYEFTLLSSEPTFNVSDTRIARNNLDSPASVTFTSQQSKTWTVTIKADAQRKFGEMLQFTVSAMYAWSKTTAVNVAVTATVPPHATIRGDYGVSAFNVMTLDHVVVWERTHGPHGGFVDLCVEGSGPVTRNVPTTLEGWQLTSA